MSLDKNAFAAQVKSLANCLWCADADGGKCLYYSAAALVMFNSLGIKAWIQAGSISWPMIAKEEDDGVCSTHFSYMWEGFTPHNVNRLACRLLPEMHVWVALPDERQVVDFSTGELPEQAKRAGFVWTGPKPPDYLWDTHIPEGVRYAPDLDATRLADLLCRFK